jgi:hypothetical protein
MPFKADTVQIVELAHNLRGLRSNMRGVSIDRTPTSFESCSNALTADQNFGCFSMKAREYLTSCVCYTMFEQTPIPHRIAAIPFGA